MKEERSDRAGVVKWGGWERAGDRMQLNDTVPDKAAGVNGGGGGGHGMKEERNDGAGIVEWGGGGGHGM